MCKLLIHHPRYQLQSEIGMFGEWEAGIFESIKSLVAPGDTVLDVGAHVGYASVMFGEWVGANGRVIAFEPFPENAELLAANIRMNRQESRVQIVRMAVME